MNYSPEKMNDMLAEVCQEASYKFGDLVLSYPPYLRAVVMAVASGCIKSNYNAMPKDEREIFDLLLPKLTILTLPIGFDPRKHGVKDRPEEVEE